MNGSALSLFTLQEQVFGVCPCCGEAFRLSDCTLFSGAAPKRSWLDRIESDTDALDALEEEINLHLESLRQAARRKGRRRAQTLIKKVDRVFAPKRLHADDAKPICHPVDYVVFDGLNARDEMERIVFLDREPDNLGRAKMQSSIRRAIEKGNVRWRELHVSDAAVVTPR